eukprot:scaffold263982_cov50-Attheya_sp.AAC.1
MIQDQNTLTWTNKKKKHAGQRKQLAGAAYLHNKARRLLFIRIVLLLTIFAIVLFLCRRGEMVDLLSSSSHQLSNNNSKNNTNENDTTQMRVTKDDSVKVIVYCPDSIERMLSSKAFGINIKMMAMPHSASSTTDRLFKLGTQFAWNASIPHDKRGFTGIETNTATCAGARNDGPHPRLKAMTCQSRSHHGSSSIMQNSKNHDTITPMDELANILGRFRYRYKHHESYESLSRSSNVLFTILRKPDQFVLSQYQMRMQWDKYRWDKEYSPSNNNDTATTSTTGSELERMDPSEWVERAWWRHNLFTKMLATDTQLIWNIPESILDGDGGVGPTQQESDEQNALGMDS